MLTELLNPARSLEKKAHNINQLFAGALLSSATGILDGMLAYCLLFRSVMMNSRSLAVDILKILNTCLGNIKEFK